MTDWSKHFAPRANAMQVSEIRELLKLLDRPDIISFAGGIPDPKLFPTKDIADACQRILSDPARSAVALQYSISEGYPPLRQWIAEYMGTLGLKCTQDNVLITNGSQQGLDFVSKLFIQKGDTILVSWPTYLGALQLFNLYEPVYDVLPGPGSNRTPSSYRGGGKPKPKFGYVMPEFQNPSGTSLTRAERVTLLDAADEMDLPLLEDAAYEHLRYDGERSPPLIALAAERAGGIDKAKVIYFGTFSKSIVPGMRLGWTVAPQEVIKKLVLVNQASDLNVSCFAQMIMHEVASKSLKSHVDKVRGLYKERRDAMLKSLAANMPDGIQWTKPEGGMFIWITLPKHVNGTELLSRAINEVQVAFVPGIAFFPDRSMHNTIRLSFSLNEPSVIDEGIKRLGKLLRSL